MAWVVARTKSLCEAVAATQCARFDAVTYLPRYFDRELARRKPLFACYLFIRRQQDLSWLWDGSIPAIIYMLTHQFGDHRRLCELEDSFVSNLKAREKYGLVVLDAIIPKFQIGDTVRLIDTAFKGQLGIYDGMTSSERVSVMLGQLRLNVGVGSIDKP